MFAPTPDSLLRLQHCPRREDTAMRLGTNLDRLQRLIHRPVSSRPDWLKHAREDAEELLWLAQRAGDDQNYDRLDELEQEAAAIADRIEERMDKDC